MDPLFAKAIDPLSNLIPEKFDISSKPLSDLYSEARSYLYLYNFYTINKDYLTKKESTTSKEFKEIFEAKKELIIVIERMNLIKIRITKYVRNYKKNIDSSPIRRRFSLDDKGALRHTLLLTSKVNSQLFSLTPKMIDFALKAGANPNSEGLRDGQRVSPLLYALQSSSEDSRKIVGLLLSAKADVHKKTSDGTSALTLACTAEKVDLELVNILIRFKADPSQKNADGSSALVLAVHSGKNPALIKKLRRASTSQTAVS